MIDIKPSPTKPGSFRVSMPIPDDISQRFDTATLARLGAQIENGRVTLEYAQSASGTLSLDRQFRMNSYEGRFEKAMDSASFADIMIERNRQIGRSRSGQQNQQSQGDIAKDLERSKNMALGNMNLPGLEAPQVSTEGPKRAERDDSEIAGFPDGTTEMKKLRAQPAKVQPKPVVHAPPRPMDSPPPSYSAPRMK